MICRDAEHFKIQNSTMNILLIIFNPHTIMWGHREVSLRINNIRCFFGKGKYAAGLIHTKTYSRTWTSEE